MKNRGGGISPGSHSCLLSKKKNKGTSSWDGAMNLRLNHRSREVRSLVVVVYWWHKLVKLSHNSSKFSQLMTVQPGYLGNKSFLFEAKQIYGNWLTNREPSSSYGIIINVGEGAWEKVNFLGNFGDVLRIDIFSIFRDSIMIAWPGISTKME